MIEKYKEIFKDLDNLNIGEKIETINEIKKELSNYSPFKNEPVDCVLWVKNDEVIANDYNPNSVAPPEMELLRLSIANDGYTQPIVTWKENEKIEVIDGFHRNRVGKECEEVISRVNGYLPIVNINSKNSDKKNRIASTIRHNRARGKHKVEAMSDIVLELKNRNWSNTRICRELGMDEDEVLRLCQITGLEDLFKDNEFSKSWDVEDSYIDEDFEPLDDYVDEEEKEREGFRTTNTSDEKRIFHTYDKWECYKAGLYATCVDGKKKEQCEIEFSNFLKDLNLFEDALKSIVSEWKYSCEHYLSNVSMNRIAWLGQACVCYATGIPNKYSSGWFLLTEKEQEEANRLAHKYLNIWQGKNGYELTSYEDSIQINRQINIY